MNHEQELGTLLARIHRDGGQYIQKHGWQKAIADADALIVGWIHAAAAPVQAVPAEFQNPWRAALENCISGDNYLRASEYRELIEELDALYRLRAAAPAAPQVLAEKCPDCGSEVSCTLGPDYRFNPPLSRPQMWTACCGGGCFDLSKSWTAFTRERAIALWNQGIRAGDRSNE